MPYSLTGLCFRGVRHRTPFPGIGPPFLELGDEAQLESTCLAYTKCGFHYKLSMAVILTLGNRGRGSRNSRSPSTTY